MNAQRKLRWVDVPRGSLRQGLACGQGGAQVLLMMADDHASVAAPATTAALRDATSEVRPAEKPR